MKIFSRIETERIINQMYGDIEFEEGINKLKSIHKVTVLNKNSKNKKWAICESVLTK